MSQQPNNRQAALNLAPQNKLQEDGKADKIPDVTGGGVEIWRQFAPVLS
jgi:hypothetical protein